MAKKAPKALKKVHCNFGSLSVGKNTASLSVKVDYAQVEERLLIDNFTWFRLYGKLTQLQEGEDPNQNQLFQDSDTVEASWQSKGVKIDHDTYGLRFTFDLHGVDVSQLVKLAARPGLFQIDSIEKLEEDE